MILTIPRGKYSMHFNNESLGNFDELKEMCTSIKRFSKITVLKLSKKSSVVNASTDTGALATLIPALITRNDGKTEFFEAYGDVCLTKVTKKKKNYERCC